MSFLSVSAYFIMLFAVGAATATVASVGFLAGPFF
jgi:hypothetical protein